MLWNNYIFVGTYKGSDYKNTLLHEPIYKCSTSRIYFQIKLLKNLTSKVKIEARDNALHLDCCFQPVGNDKGIIYKNGFGRG
jgi:hypothetical protein